MSFIRKAKLFRRGMGAKECINIMEISVMDRDYHSPIDSPHSYSLDAFHEQMLSRSQKNQEVMAKCPYCLYWEGNKLFVYSPSRCKSGTCDKRTPCSHLTGSLVLLQLSVVIPWLTLICPRLGPLTTLQLLQNISMVIVETPLELKA